MSSIFQDTDDIYADSTWEASPWRNYIRVPDDNLRIESAFPTDNIDFDLWVTEEELIGHSLAIYATQASTDNLTRLSLYNPSGIEMSRGSDFLSLSSSAHNAPAFWTDPGYSWIAPGIAFRFAENVSSTTSITSNRSVTVTIPSSAIPEKRFDGGLHCWIKLDTVSAGIATVQYTKPFGGEFINNQDCLLVFNGLSNKHSYGSGSNKAFSMYMEGSVDGINWDTLDKFINDVDISDNATVGMSDSLQIAFMLSGTNFQKYYQYRFKWLCEDGTGSERLPQKQNFVKLSLYKI